MGGPQSKMMDRRTSRLIYSKEFIDAISKYRNDIITTTDYANESIVSLNDANTRVCVRKKPPSLLVPTETYAGLIDDYDVVTVSNNKVTVHDCRMKSDMKQMFIQNRTFDFSATYNEDSTSDDIYNEEVQSIVQHVVTATPSSPAYGTVMLFGQTGSGKTYTHDSIVEFVSKDIFDMICIRNSGNTHVLDVYVSYMEIAGESCYDLLQTSSTGCDRVPVNLLTNEDGKVEYMHLSTHKVCTSSELLRMVYQGRSIRTSAATALNDNSSRSHAIIQITIRESPILMHTNNVDDTCSTNSSGVTTASSVVGTMLLIDLAGSEMKNDSMHHDADRRYESKQIMMSLNALKECIRSQSIKGGARSGAAPIPYNISATDACITSTSEGALNDNTIGDASTLADEEVELTSEANKEVTATSMSNTTSTSSQMFNFRRSKLTMALRNSFTSFNGKSVVIATVSCGSMDTEHTINNLRYVSLLYGKSEAECGGASTSVDVCARKEGGREQRVIDSLQKGSSDSTKGTGAIDSTSSLDKTANATVSNTNDVCGMDAEVQRLETLLSQEGLSQATVYGLKRQLQKRKAIVKRQNKQTNT